eukprot:scaffold64718_cov63-Phaeocystis_antarctica.AAC.4
MALPLIGRQASCEAMRFSGPMPAASLRRRSSGFSVPWSTTSWLSSTSTSRPEYSCLRRSTASPFSPGASMSVAASSPTAM